jgi:hypothetical protein
VAAPLLAGFSIASVITVTAAAGTEQVRSGLAARAAKSPGRRAEDHVWPVEQFALALGAQPGSPGPVEAFAAFPRQHAGEQLGPRAVP